MMMQCGTSGELVAPRRVEKETIHSGHFMVSHFEAEAQVDEDELIVPGLDDDDDKAKVLEVSGSQTTQVTDINELNSTNKKISHHQQLSIETNLTKLFQCMSLAYRQKLTSPKWNRFKGVRLRWKDKIRLNNLIWRCWHMQFIMKQNTLVCQFASPLDVDTHNKPEAVVLEGKYWKRRLAAVTAEYKKWRLFHRNRVLGCINKDASEVLSDMDILDWQSQNNDSMHMLVDEDYMTLMTDTLFSTISANQPYAFPDSREIARAGLADFIQPSLGPLQPNLEDFMDTLEPLQELISGSKLPSVPEENVIDDSYRSLNQNYTELNLLPTVSSTTNISDLQATEMHSDYGTSSNNQLVENFVNLYNTDTQTNTLINRNNRILNRYDSGNRRELQAQLSQESTVPDLHELPSQTQQLFNSNQFQNFQIIDVTSSVPSNQTFKVPTSPSSTSSTHQSFKISNPRSINFQPAQNVNTISNNQISRHFKIPTMPDTKQSWSTPSASVQQFTNQSPTKISSDSEIQVKDPLRANLGFVISGTKYGTKQRATRVRSSSLEPRQNRPPLKSSVSDPALLSNANSLLLAQLLSNNSQNMYNTSTVSRTVSEKLNTSGVLAHSSHSNPSSTGSMQILSVPNQSNLTTTLLITPVGIASHSNSTNVPQNQMVVSSLSSSSSHTKTPSPQSSMSVESPTSPLSPSNSPGAHTDIPHREQRRVGHIHAEQKRRYNIKNGFEMLHSLIPQLNQNPNVKLSKAAMLQKGAEYIRQLRNERTQLSEEIESLKQQIECLNSSISNCQSLLPATGAPVSRQRANKMKEMFDEYVRTRTLMNWKFWVFSVLFEPLLISYNNAVSTSSMDDLYRSTLLWVEQHCSLVDLRPAVLNSLRLLSTKTEILSDPDRLPEEARQAVMETAAHQGQH